MRKETSPNLASLQVDRREFVGCAIGAAGLVAGALQTSTSLAAEEKPVDEQRRFWFSVKSGMINDPSCKTWVEKFQLLKDLGYDGVEYDQALDANPHEIAEASAKVGLPVQGLV